MTLTYKVVVLHERDGRYSAIVPGLPGCGTWGDDLPEALRMAEEAILGYMDAVEFLGETPPPDVPTVTVDLGDATEASVYNLTVALEEKAQVA
jgi:predicted RNase H-like HicB family nuclease